MGTTELHAEQVIVGGVVGAAALLPWLPDVNAWLKAGGGELDIAAGALAIAVAYVAGVLFDRLADTLTEWLERCHRLLVAESAEADGLPQRGHPWQDPFPEDALRMRVLEASSGVLRWVDYHRSRVRITRALAVYLPLVTWSLALGLTRTRGDQRLIWLVALEPLALAVVMVAARPARSKDDPRGPGRFRLPRAPKTHAPAAEREEFLARDHSARRKAGDAPLGLLARHPAIWVSGILLVASVTLGAVGQFVRWPHSIVLAPVAALAALSVLSWWAWWRISWTYRTYLRLAAASLDEARSAAPDA